MNPLLLPIIAAQAIWVRLTTEKLPPAAGPAIGAAGDASHPPVRIGVLGESTAAGCGVDIHDNGFPGALARELAARGGQSVSWEVIGQNSATIRHIRYRLLPQLGKDLDVAVLLAGVNDTLAGRTPEQWGADLAAIVDDLTDRARLVAVTGVPPFDAFPSLPATLGRFLAQRAGALDDVSAKVCAARPRATWISSTDSLPMGPDDFARDRFHPSASGYRRWAEAVADHLTL